MNPIAILQRLSHRHFCSGSEIASQLGVSRASVHNALASAKALGVEVFAVHGRGYRLVEPLSWLNADALQAQLGTQGWSLDFALQRESTNRHLMDLSRQCAPHRQIVLTEWQSAGRGRRGRGWQALPGGGLLFSVLWRFSRPVGALSGLSLAVGVALAEGLQKQGMDAVQLKWPNDLLWQGRKLGGILIELEGDMLGPGNAVIGVGLNVRLPDALRARIDQPTADVFEALGACDRNALLLSLLDALDVELTAFEQSGFAPARSRWEALHAWQNQPVRVLLGNGETQEGVLRGIDAQGALRVDDGGVIHTLHSGEVSVRRRT